MKTLGLIPARGGSKGIPRKNVSMLHGRHLIEHTLDAAKGSHHLSRVVVSTDDDEIARIALGAGAEVPFRRPKHLASDRSTAIEVIRHALDALEEEGWKADAVAYLQPTSPFRSSHRIDEAISLLASTRADCVVSVQQVPHRFVPSALMTLNDGDLTPLVEGAPLRRQDRESLLARNGPAILVLDAAFAREDRAPYGGRVLPLEMGFVESIDIDAPHDLQVAEALAPLAAELQGRRDTRWE